MKTHLTKNTMERWFRLTLIMLMLMQPILLFGQMNARRNSAKLSPKFYIGVEATGGTHAFLCTSDIPELSGLKFSQAGKGIGIMAGIRHVRVRVKKSSFKSALYVREKLETTAMEGSLNIYPLQILGNRFRSYEPYLIAGVGKSNYQFFGNYVGLPPPSTGQSACPGEEGEMIPHDPDLIANISERPLPEGTLLNDLRTRDTFAGLGIEAHIHGKSIFVHLFGELKYVFAKKEEVNNPAFNDTSVVVPLILSVGVGVGLKK